MKSFKAVWVLLPMQMHCRVAGAGRGLANIHLTHETGAKSAAHKSSRLKAHAKSDLDIYPKVHFLLFQQQK